MIGPVVLVLPILSAVLGALVLYDRGEDARGTTPAPEVADPDDLVAGWRASHTFADGSRLDLEVLPLHADPVRQAFDARALAARLRLAPGAPWQLNTKWSRGPDPGAAPDVETGGLALSALAIEAGHGTRLATLTSLAETPAASDPIHTLFATPQGPLRPGEQATLVMWSTATEEPTEGDARLDPARLSGLEWGTEAPGSGPEQLDLEPFRVPRRAITSILATVDPPAARGTASSGKDSSRASSRVRAPDSRGL